MTYQEFIDKHGIKLKATPVKKRPEKFLETWGGQSWKLVLKCGGRQMTFYFTQGPAHGITSPDINGVLECLNLDLTRGETFEEWCSSMGGNPDSIKQLKTFELLQKNEGELRKLFGKSIFRDFESLIDE